MAETGNHLGRRVVVAAFVVAAVLLAGASAAWACVAVNNAYLRQLQPNSGEAGTQVTARGGNWENEGVVELHWAKESGEPEQQLGEAQPDGDGRFSAQVTVPADAEAGSYYVTATQETEDGTAEASAPFEVTKSEPAEDGAQSGGDTDEETGGETQEPQENSSLSTSGGDGSSADEDEGSSGGSTATSDGEPTQETDDSSSGDTSGDTSGTTSGADDTSADSQPSSGDATGDPEPASPEPITRVPEPQDTPEPADQSQPAGESQPEPQPELTENSQPQPEPEQQPATGRQQIGEGRQQIGDAGPESQADASRGSPATSGTPDDSGAAAPSEPSEGLDLGATQPEPAPADNDGPAVEGTTRRTQPDGAAGDGQVSEERGEAGGISMAALEHDAGLRQAPASERSADDPETATEDLWGTDGIEDEQPSGLGDLDESQAGSTGALVGTWLFLLAGLGLLAGGVTVAQTRRHRPLGSVLRTRRSRP